MLKHPRPNGEVEEGDGLFIVTKCSITKDLSQLSVQSQRKHLTVISLIGPRSTTPSTHSAQKCSLLTNSAQSINRLHPTANLLKQIPGVLRDAVLIEASKMVTDSYRIRDCVRSLRSDSGDNDYDEGVEYINEREDGNPYT
ncbi:hypothetical protein ACTXT7_007623 [Hymenolepis weldensis]